MRAFVTSGTGFVVSDVVRSLLESGYKVTALVRPNSNLGNLRSLEIDIVKGHLNDSHIWKQMHGCNYLFYVARHYSL
jgi:uncharacterized protein YbjT (DUF2867 family)